MSFRTDMRAHGLALRLARDGMNHLIINGTRRRGRAQALCGIRKDDWLPVVEDSVTCPKCHASFVRTIETDDSPATPSPEDTTR